MIILTALKSTSQNISIELPKEQWQEIEKGLRKGKKDKKLVKVLQEALIEADKVNKLNNDIINHYKDKNALYQREIRLLEQKINSLSERNKINEQILIVEQKKGCRWG